MTIKTTIEEAARHALKNQEPEMLMTLRMVLAAIKNREIDQRAKTGTPELDDEAVLSVLRTEAKKRRDAAGEYRKAGHEERAAKEDAECAIIEKYLPAQFSDEDIEKLLAPLAQGATMSDFGRVMKSAIAAVGGRASGDRVSAAVRRMLADSKA